MNKKAKQQLNAVARQWKKARKRCGDVALQYPHVAQQIKRRAVELRRQSAKAFQEL